jgi:cobalt/nickel transport system permease protein
MSCHAAMELDHNGDHHSPLHRIDALAKLLATMAFVLTVISFPNDAVVPLLPYLLFPLFLVIFGEVPWRPFLTLLLAGLPFIAVAALSNLLLNHKPVHAFGLEMHAGVLSGISILLRYLLTAAAVLALIGTTSFNRILQALGQLHLPRSFLMLLQCMYRYLFVLVEEGRSISHARLLRDPGHRLPDLRTARGMLASLFLRSWERAERVYRGMLLRGYDGELPITKPSRWHWRDLAFVVLVSAACLAGRLIPWLTLSGGTP